MFEISRKLNRGTGKSGQPQRIGIPDGSHQHAPLCKIRGRSLPVDAADHHITVEPFPARSFIAQFKDGHALRIRYGPFKGFLRFIQQNRIPIYGSHLIFNIIIENIGAQSHLIPAGTSGRTDHRCLRHHLLGGVQGRRSHRGKVLCQLREIDKGLGGNIFRHSVRHMAAADQQPVLPRSFIIIGQRDGGLAAVVIVTGCKALKRAGVFKGVPFIRHRN